MAGQSLSRRHHFVPQFYLRRWHDPAGGGFWLYSRDKKGRISLRRRPATSIAFESELYSFRPDRTPTRKSAAEDEIERKFFEPLDDAAAVVHQKLAKVRITELSFDEKRVWALFLNSLIERRPDRIQEIAQSISSEEIVQELTRRRPSARLQAMLRSIDLKAMIRNSVLTVIPAFIVDEPFIDYLAKAVWNTFDLPEGADHFLTGDRPLVVNAGGMDGPIYCLAIAVSPKRLLVIHKDAPEFDFELVKNMAVSHNIQISKQTMKYLVSSRKLADSRHIKYLKIVDKMLTPGTSNAVD